MRNTSINQTDTHTDTKERILNAAKKEFAEKGFDGARMNSISARSRANQALIHYYFGNKENLYREVLHKLFIIEHSKKLWNYIDQLDLSPSEKLYIIIYLVVNIHIEVSDLDISKLIAREIIEERTQIHSFVKEYIIPRHELMEAVIIEGIRTGEFSTKNSLFVVMSMHTLLLYYVQHKNLFKGTKWYNRLYGKNNKEELLEFLLENTFKALRPVDKPLSIPMIPMQVIEFMDMLIGEIKQNQKALIAE